VNGGSARGTRLAAVGPGTRALTDRVKESLFATLEAEGVVGPGRAFLDLFSGTGAGGIEALSRGSERATLVEKEPSAIRVIEENLRRTKVLGATVVRADVLVFLERDTEVRFDAVLVDPPYASDVLGPILNRLADPAAGWLAEDAVVVTRHFWRNAPDPKIGVLERYRDKRFGETMVTMYRKHHS
jgi:16S rRNA (guanine(966)-N(2))-methyltransferase RsmD